MTLKMKIGLGIFGVSTALLVYGYITNAQWLQVAISVVTAVLMGAPS